MSQVFKSLMRSGTHSMLELGPTGRNGSRPESGLPTVPEANPFRIVPLRIPAGLPLLPFQDANTEAAEQYRILRTNIRQHPLRPKVIAITSPRPGDGKTITAINVSATLALKDNSRVLLIDGDLRQRTVGSVLGLELEHGLSDVVSGKCTIDKAIVQTDRIPNLHVLPTGLVEANPTEVLDSDVFRSLVTGLRNDFTYIIFDTTPFSIFADFKLVEQVCDGSIFVVRPGVTDRSAFLKALDNQPQDRLLGIVVNAFHDWFLYKYSGGSYYYRRPVQKGG